MLNTPYKHTQVGYAILIPCIAAACVLLIDLHALGYSPAAPFVALVLLAVGALFSSLTIRVESDYLVWKFGPGLIWKKVPLALIEDARAVRIPWIAGWGIHYTGPNGGWLYNVSGMRAVQVF